MYGLYTMSKRGKQVIRENLYGEDPYICGSTVTINNVSYIVVGVMYKPVAAVNPFGNEEDMVFIPYTTADMVYGLDGKISHLSAFLPVDIAKGENKHRLKQFIEQIHDVEDEGYDLYIIYKEEGGNERKLANQLILND